MFNDYKDYWNKLSTLEKIVAILLFPITLLVATVLSRFGLIILIGIVIILITDEEIPSNELVGMAGAIALLISIIMLIKKK